MARRVNSLIDLVARIGGPVTIGIYALSASMYNGMKQNPQIIPVEGGERAVIFDRFRGVLNHISGEGTHFLIPGIQQAIKFDVRTRPRNISTTTGSKGLDYDDRVLPSIGNEVLKSVVAQFDAGELITQREVVSQRIRDELVKRAREFNLLLEDVSITHLTFGKEFTSAVEQKQVAQQEAERARFVVEKAEQEKTASIIRAEGEAQAALMISKAVEKFGKGLIELRRVEAAKEIAETLSSSSNVSYLPNNNGQQLLLNISQ